MPRRVRNVQGVVNCHVKGLAMRSTTRTGLRGIVQATIPVSDLARSAQFYADLLGLRYVREFGDGTTVTGCALADFDARCFIALRRRDRLAGGEADLRGEHPVIRERATRLGLPSTSGTHADGTWIEFLDPDGIALRIVHTPTPTESFLGVSFGPDGQQAFYDEPKLEVSKRPHQALIASGH
jgi:catechol 2,3-dioxygenase-like lactoylglutathione lyase family enzyme